ncbi:MAG: phosphoglycerate kinase [Candidatus Pacebacteria bacterium]|nr:phosphoglycerate kinase [Candidatus Paceibacterota bacterium]
MKYLKKLAGKDLTGKTCLLRVDFNLKSPKDIFRIKAILPTLKFLLEKNTKVLILSHRGRPKGADKNLSLEQMAETLSGEIGKKVIFLRSFDFNGIKMYLKLVEPGTIFLLENLRFLKEEEENDSALAKKLASLGDFYVNDAFAVSHRANTSVAAITKYLPSYAGLLMEQEIKNLSLAFRPKKPLVVILGGSKITDKIGIIRNLSKQAKYFLLGSSALNLSSREVKPYLKMKKVVLPVDSAKSGNNHLDIGPKTINEYRKLIKGAKTIIWNGPVGFNEKKRYAIGSASIARMIINSGAFTIVGGGETTNFLVGLNLDKKIKFLSTGGGAMLEFLAGKKLPGIKALK